MKSPAGDGLAVLIVERGDHEAWALMPELLRRVTAFCVQYDSDAKNGMLQEALIRSFVLPNPGYIGMLLIKDGAIIGHLVVALEDWMGVRMATIVQIEADVHLSPEIVDVPLKWLEDWARLSGANYFQCLARNDALARLFQSKYGFERKRILMRKPLVVDDDRQEARTVPVEQPVEAGVS